MQSEWLPIVWNQSFWVCLFNSSGHNDIITSLINVSSLLNQNKGRQLNCLIGKLLFYLQISTEKTILCAHISQPISCPYIFFSFAFFLFKSMHKRLGQCCFLCFKILETRQTHWRFLVNELVMYDPCHWSVLSCKTMITLRFPTAGWEDLLCGIYIDLTTLIAKLCHQNFSWTNVTL